TLTVTPQPQVKKKRGRPVGLNKQKKKQVTPLENSFQEYNVLSNMKRLILNFGQNYHAQKSSNGPKRRGRPRGSTTIKRNTENSSVKKSKRERKN
ncbi:hypothetical protein BpHYR1_030291, partial [Brachionus plicatilis]